MGRKSGTRRGRAIAPQDQRAPARASAASRMDGLAAITPWLAVAFATLCLATIPYGAPFSRAYGLVLVGCCVAMLGCARMTACRWDGLTLWPMLLLLAAYGLGCATSVDPTRSMARFAVMPLFAMLHVAMQLASGDQRALRAVCAVGVLAALVIVVDVAMARFANRSLFQGAVPSVPRPSGSQGNPNDLAAASLLLPLAWVLVPSKRAVLWYAGCAAVVALAWVLSAGRQVAIGWVVAALVPIVLQMGWRRGVGAVIVLLGAGVLVVMTEPALRARLLETIDGGLGDRKPLITFGTWLWWQRPWIGHGPGTFGELYMQAALSDWSWHGVTLARVGMPWPHNLLIEVLDDLGLVGLAAFTLVTGAAMRRVRQGLAAGGQQRRLAVAVAAIALAIAAVSVVDLSFIKDWFRCVFWITLGLAFAIPDADKGDLAAKTAPPSGAP